MAHGSGGGQPPWDEQQNQPRNSGELPAHDQPWQPSQYDPHAHQQRPGGGQPPPQQQPGYGGAPPPPGYGGPPWQPPQQPPRRKPWVLRHKVLSSVIAVILIGVIASIASQGGGDKTPAASPATAVTQAATPSPSATPTQDPLDAVYTSVCQALDDGASQGDVVNATDSQLKKDGITGYTGAGIVQAAEKKDCPSYLPQNHTVTYVVTGSSADVTYGTAGSDLSGSVPMHVTKNIPDKAPIYYSINAQLQGDGTVSCKIEVDGKVISQSTASGGYNIADCEIGQDPLSGDWQDMNTA